MMKWNGRLRVFQWLGLALLTGGCETPAPETEHAARAPNKQQVAHGASPLIDLKVPSLAQASFQGELREVAPAGPYLYLLVLRADGSESWVTTLATNGHRVGDQVKVKSFGARRGFHSKRLDRTFDELHFGMVSTITSTETALVSKEEQR
jgi:hypothetical protein